MVRESGIEGMVTVGEMSSTTLENCIRYSCPQDKELSMVFNFHHLKVDYKDGDKWQLMPPDIKSLKELFAKWQEGMQAGQGWNATFWCNHDQPRAVSRFGDEGIWREKSAKMLGACIHLMRGTPYIYQGEEIGMTNAGYASIDQYRDVESLNYYDILCREGKSSAEALAILAARSRDNGRTPMQWSAEAYAGFSSHEPWLLPPDNYKKINVEAARQDKDSIFAFYQQLIRLRHERKIIAEGKISFLERENEDVIAYERILGAERLVVLCNFRGQEVSLREKSLQDYQAEGLHRVLGNYEDVGYALRPFEAVVLTNE